MFADSTTITIQLNKIVTECLMVAYVISSMKESGNVFYL